MNTVVDKKNSKKGWLGWWLLREPISILSESSIFIVFTVLLLSITPYNLQENALKIIFESVGIESFFLTLILTIIILPLFLIFLGPYIDPANRKHYDGWLFEQFGWNDKFKHQFVKINQQRYEKVFIPLHQFNLSFGIGTIGVLLGLLFWQLIYQEIQSVTLLCLSIFYMVIFVLTSKFIRYVSTFNHLNEMNLKPNDVSIRYTVIVAVIASLTVAITSFPEIKEKLNKPLVSKQCDD